MAALDAHTTLKARFVMMNIPTLAIGALGLALLPHAVYAQDLSRYRTFELGTSVASVLTATGASPTDVKTRHQRPALLRDLEWRPSRWVTGTVAASTDPVDQVTFRFYEDQLFRIVVNYGHERTAGLTDGDMIEAISVMYGMPLLPASQASRSPSATPDAESGSIVARWGDADHAAALYRTAAYGDTWRLIVTSTAVDTLARRAESQALKLDVIEAPQREIDRQKQERDREREAADKARDVNKPSFRP